MKPEARVRQIAGAGPHPSWRDLPRTPLQNQTPRFLTLSRLFFFSCVTAFFDKLPSFKNSDLRRTLHTHRNMAFTEGAPAHGKVAHLLPQTYKRLVSEWLEEDTPSLDYGGFVVGEDMAEARLLGKSKVGVPVHCFFSLL